MYAAVANQEPALNSNTSARQSIYSITGEEMFRGEENPETATDLVEK